MNIKTAGVFFRPQDTPAGKKGWWVEILFSCPWYVKSEDKFDISKRFATKEEADNFFAEKNEMSGKEMHILSYRGAGAVNKLALSGLDQ